MNGKVKYVILFLLEIINVLYYNSFKAVTLVECCIQYRGRGCKNGNYRMSNLQ